MTVRNYLIRWMHCLSRLHSIYFGVYLIHDLSQKTLDAIVSYGERLSSNIVATLVKGSKWMDSRNFIKTTPFNGKNTLDSELTSRLVKDAFHDLPRVSLVPGFISSDRDTGEVTNLGRGGSDYTAAIIAANLDAEILEIWTDVDGFMTADPRVIKTAYTIDEAQLCGSHGAVQLRSKGRLPADHLPCQNQEYSHTHQEYVQSRCARHHHQG